MKKLITLEVNEEMCLMMKKLDNFSISRRKSKKDASEKLYVRDKRETSKTQKGVFPDDSEKKRS